MTYTYAQTRNEIKRITTEAQRKADGIKLNAKHDILRSYLHKLLGTDISNPAPIFPVAANAELEQLREQLEAARHETQQQIALAAKLANELEVARNSEQRLMAQVTALSVDTDTLTQELEETQEALAHTQASLKSANEVINTMKRTASSKPEPKQSKPATAPQLHELTRLIIDKELSRGDAQVKAADAVSTYMYLNDTRTDALYDYLLHGIYAEPAMQALIDKAVRTAVALPPLDNNAPSTPKPVKPNAHELTQLLVNRYTDPQGSFKPSLAVSTYVEKHDIDMTRLNEYITTQLFAEPAVVSLLNSQVLQAIAMPAASTVELEPDTTPRKQESTWYNRK